MTSPDLQEFRWKQCLVIRGDIRMSCGKISAQAAHAAVAAFERCDRETRERWLSEGQKKVVLKVKNEKTLLELKTIADARGIAAALIQDAGLTEIPPGTTTALGLGPARTEEMDRITSDLPLL
jgi:PTH2 family peptidyl-tRNA hydrolase